MEVHPALPYEEMVLLTGLRDELEHPSRTADDRNKIRELARKRYEAIKPEDIDEKGWKIDYEYDWDSMGLGLDSVGLEEKAVSGEYGKGGSVKPKAKKIEKKKDMWHVMFRPKGKFEAYKTPDWAEKVADSVYDGAEITMGYDEDTDKWQMQKVMIPVSVKDENKVKKLAEEIACKIDYKCRKKFMEKGGKTGSENVEEKVMAYWKRKEKDDPAFWLDRGERNTSEMVAMAMENFEELEQEGIVDMWAMRYDRENPLKSEKGGAVNNNNNSMKNNNFWSSYANDGALVTGGSYDPIEKKGFGGFLFGFGLGTVVTWIYKDRVRAAKEKAKWKVIEAIDRLEKGGSVGSNKTKMTQQEEAALRWHLRNNVVPAITDKNIDKIIKTINGIRSGEELLTDTIGDSDVTVNDMISDLKLEDFIPEEIYARTPFEKGGKAGKEKWFEYPLYFESDGENYVAIWETEAENSQEADNIFDSLVQDELEPDIIKKHLGKNKWKKVDRDKMLDSTTFMNDLQYALETSTIEPEEIKEKGGSASGIARDRKYTSQQEHELGYKDKRKSRVRYYQKRNE